MFSFVWNALSRNPFSRKSREEKLVQNLKLLVENTALVQKLVNELKNDSDFTEDISGQILYQIPNHIDTSEIAQEFSIYDIAYEIDTSEIASEMDVCEVAQYIEINEYDIEVDYDELVSHMDLNEFAQVIDIESLAATTTIQDGLNDIKENIISDVVSEIKDRLDD